jgi:hypothetical protein
MKLRVTMFMKNRPLPISIVTDWPDGEIPEPFEVNSRLEQEGRIEKTDGNKVSWDDRSIEFMEVGEDKGQKTIEPTEAPPPGMRRN